MKKNEIRNIIFEIFIFCIAFFGVKKLCLENTHIFVYKVVYTALVFIFGVSLKFLYRRNRLLNETFLGLITYTILLFEFYFMMIFAQYYLIATVIIYLIVLSVHLFLPDIIHIATGIADDILNNKRLKRKYKELFQSISAIIICVILIIPSIIGINKELKLKTLSDKDCALLCKVLSDDEQVCGKSNLSNKKQKILNDINSWSDLDKEERFNLLSDIALCEKKKLGIRDSVVITTCAEIMDKPTVAYYTETDKTIHLNIEYICDNSACDNILGICHEIFHAYQHDLINSLNFKSDEIRNGHYFQLAREWYSNLKNYKSYSVEDFDEYYNQPVEVSAREYAQTRSNEYMQMANSLKGIGK